MVFESKTVIFKFLYNTLAEVLAITSYIYVPVNVGIKVTLYDILGDSLIFTLPLKLFVIGLPLTTEVRPFKLTGSLFEVPSIISNIKE